jgi:hypothetical protein
MASSLGESPLDQRTEKSTFVYGKYHVLNKQMLQPRETLTTNRPSLWRYVAYARCCGPLPSQGQKQVYRGRPRPRRKRVRRRVQVALSFGRISPKSYS